MRLPLKELAFARPRFGYRQLCVLMWNKGIRVGKNRVFRIYKEERLGLGHRKFKKRRSHLRVTPLPPLRPNERWAMDFMTDETTDYKKFRCLNVVDILTRKALGGVVDIWLPSGRVIECLDRCAKRNGGYPELITCDNGPEFISLELDEWARKHGVKLYFIRPGRPTENGFIESYNARVRDECLETHAFKSVDEARIILQYWRHDYNSLRP